MSSGVILLQRHYISFSSPLLLILRWEIIAAAVALLSNQILHKTTKTNNFLVPVIVLYGSITLQHINT